MEEEDEKIREFKGEHIIPDEEISPTVISQVMKAEILASREAMEKVIEDLQRKVQHLLAENQALKLELQQALAERDDYKRLLAVETAYSREVLAKYLLLLDKYKALSLAAMSMGVRMADLSSRYAQVLKYGMTQEDISEKLREKIRVKDTLDELEAAFAIISKARELSRPEIISVPLPTEEKKKGEKK